MECWIVVNMMYSDYCTAAEKLGCNKSKFYAELAEAFLFDKDDPNQKEKIGAYYAAIV